MALKRFMLMIQLASTRLFTTSFTGISAAYSLTPVQETSLLVAYWRHLETQQANGLIQDFPAGQLIRKLLTEERIQAFQESPTCERGQEILAVRTRAIDDWLLFNPRQDLIPRQDANQKRQLVNLGAGMCARYYRLDGLYKFYDQMWEVDSDLELLNIKNEVLQKGSEPGNSMKLPLCHLEGDLASTSLSSLESSLLESSFETSKPTDWIMEGVLEYIDPSQHATILDFTRQISAPGSRMALQVLEEPLRDYFLNELQAEALPWQRLPPLPSFEDSANKCGWEMQRVIRPNDWKELYGRDLSHIPGFNMVFLTRSS